MTHYLVVAHQTATSPELIAYARLLAASDRDARFTLLIPATHPTDLLRWDPEARFTWDERATYDIASSRALQAHARFEREGLRVERAAVGDASPTLAIEDELRLHPGRYDALVISTLPTKQSRWLAGGLASRAQDFGLPVSFVGATPAAPRLRLPRLHIPTPGLLRRLAAGGDREAIVAIALLALIYVLGSFMLAFNVDRGFLLNDAIAIVAFGIILASLALAATRRPG